MVVVVAVAETLFFLFFSCIQGFHTYAVCMCYPPENRLPSILAKSLSNKLDFMRLGNVLFPVVWTSRPSKSYLVVSFVRNLFELHWSSKTSARKNNWWKPSSFPRSGPTSKLSKLMFMILGRDGTGETFGPRTV